MSRSNARAAAMQLIFEHLSGGDGGEESLQFVYDTMRFEPTSNRPIVADDEPEKDDRSFIASLLAGVLEHLDELDEKIASFSKGWAIDRMPLVDLTILRLATWELLFESDVPGNVVISEAVNLANRYSDPEKSSRFINGVLGSILREKEAEAEAKA